MIHEFVQTMGDANNRLCFDQPRIIVIGAGIGGLTTAAILAKAGLHVTVLEAHVYPGGCAGTFYHQAYKFDAGATLAGGFYPGGPMDIVAQAAGVPSWPTQSAAPVMRVHLPDETYIDRWSGEERWSARQEAFGSQAASFWQWQERTANALWQLALRTPPWPPQTARDLHQLLWCGADWLGSDWRHHLHPALLADCFRPVAAHLRGATDKLRLFVDAQLMIAAQTTSAYANALYGAAALDLPRRGVVHLAGGMGAIAQTLAQAVQNHGGRVLYRQEVTRIRNKQRPIAVETKRGATLPADCVIANLPPWNIAQLTEEVPASLRHLPPIPQPGGGAFMLYVGIDSAAIPPAFPLHHQVIVREPLGEGNTLFLSLSPAWDTSRAPAGKRALTISTHTRLEHWWALFEDDRKQYEARRHDYTNRILAAAERALPALRTAADLIKPATPVTFQRFTRRAYGWVGGFPQTSLLRQWGPRLAPHLWMVGDTIFPGQSTAAVALGGVRVAHSLLAQMGLPVTTLYASHENTYLVDPS